MPRLVVLIYSSPDQRSGHKQQPRLVVCRPLASAVGVQATTSTQNTFSFDRAGVYQRCIESSDYSVSNVTAT